MRFIPAGLILALAACGARLAAADSLADSVRALPPHPAGIPASAVVLRGLKPRESGPNSTLAALTAFHATRLEWIYGLNPQFVAAVRQHGVSVAAAVNTAIGTGLERYPHWQDRFEIKDLNGQSTTASWMRTWHGLWLCINHPEVREAILAQSKIDLDLGVTDFQRDDPLGNFAAFDWGACFCDDCMSGFRVYLAKTLSVEDQHRLGITDLSSFNYAAFLRAHHAPVGDQFKNYTGGILQAEFKRFQEQSMVDFFIWWRKEMDRYAGRHVPVSFNNGGGIDRRSPRIMYLADWGIGELPQKQATPEFLVKTAKDLIQAGRHQTFTMPLSADPDHGPAWVQSCRATLATIYALGMQMEVPWDTFLPAPSAPRYFGDPQDFADLYGFIRTHADLLDGYDLCFAFGRGGEARPDGQSKPAIRIEDGTKQILGVVRAKAKDLTAPVVVHLANWKATPTGCRIIFDPARIFGGRRFKVTWLTPTAATPLPLDGDNSVVVPAWRDWGILKLTLTASRE